MTMSDLFQKKISLWLKYLRLISPLLKRHQERQGSRSTLTENSNQYNDMGNWILQTFYQAGNLNYCEQEHCEASKLTSTL